MLQHPAFKNPHRLFLFVGVCLLIGLAITVSQYGLVQTPPLVLLLDGVVSGLIFGALTMLLWYVVCFAGLTENDGLQKFINYAALILLINVIWLGADSFLMYLFVSNENFSAISKSIPMKAVLGFLLYTLAIGQLIKQSLKEHSLEDEPEDQKKPDSHKLGVDEVYVNPVGTMEWHEKITVKAGQKIHVIAVTDVLFLQAEGDYVKIVTASSRFIKEQTMKYFEEHLAPTKFVRIHRSYIVNIDTISRIELYEKQYYRVTLHSGHQLKASASGYKLLKNTLQL